MAHQNWDFRRKEPAPESCPGAQGGAQQGGAKLAPPAWQQGADRGRGSSCRSGAQKPEEPDAELSVTELWDRRLSLRCNPTLPHLSPLQVTLQARALFPDREMMFSKSLWGSMTPLVENITLDLWFLFSGNTRKRGEIICCLKGT